MVIHLAAYLPLYSAIGSIAPQLAMIPALLAGWVLGRRGTAAIVLLLLGAHILLQLTLADGDLAFHPAALFGYAMGALLGQVIVSLRRIWRDLSLERELLRTLIDTVPDLIFMKDADLRFTTVNKAMAEFFALAGPEEAVGKKDFDLMPEAHARERLQDDLQVIQSGRPLLQREEFADGGPLGKRGHLTSKVPIRSPAGRVVGLIGTTRDITELMRQKDLQRENEELSQAVEMRDGFLAQVSHEVRAPLTSVIGYAGLLQSGALGPLTDKQQSAANHLNLAGKHQLQLVNGLLDLARLQANAIAWDPTVVDVQSICQEALDIIQVLAAENNLSVETAWSPDAGTLMFDARLLRQIIINLLSNAVKFTPEGGIIGIRTASGDGNVKITVWDTGIGIAEEDFSRIFDPFQQLSSGSDRKYLGAGLGLALVQEVITAHRGTVGLKSEVGHGSEFTIELLAS